MSSFNTKSVVGPNYHDWRVVYPELRILQERYLDILEEAKQVGTWVPWPEDHYAKDIERGNNITTVGSSSGNKSSQHAVEEEEEEEEDRSVVYDATEAAWTVFPFLHTFPAYEESNMTWIKSTCAHCPITSELIARIPNVRTALFSRMTAGCVLGSHTGKCNILHECFLTN